MLIKTANYYNDQLDTFIKERQNNLIDSLL